MLSVLCHDMVVFCRDKVSPNSMNLLSRQTFSLSRQSFVAYIAETELCVMTDSFHVATESSLLLDIG